MLRVKDRESSLDERFCGIGKQLMSWTIIGLLFAVFSGFVTVMGFVVDYGSFIERVKDIWKWLRRHPWFLQCCLITFVSVLSLVFLQEYMQKDVQITDLKYRSPATVSVKGSYKNIGNNQLIWVYVFATDSNYYIYDAKMDFKTKVWEAGEFRIGDEDKFGGIYKVGILLAEPGRCLSQNEGGLKLKELPACAKSFGNSIEFERDLPLKL